MKTIYFLFFTFILFFSCKKETEERLLQYQVGHWSGTEYIYSIELNTQEPDSFSRPFEIELYANGEGRLIKGFYSCDSLGCEIPSWEVVHLDTIDQLKYEFIVREDLTGYPVLYINQNSHNYQEWTRKSKSVFSDGREFDILTTWRLNRVE